MKCLKLFQIVKSNLFLLCVIFLQLFFCSSALAQCNNNGNTACNSVNGFYLRGHVTPTKYEWQSVNFSSGTPEYITFDGVAGKTYEFRTCSNQNMELTIAHENGSNRREYDSNTYYCAGNGDNEYALYTVIITGRYRVVMSRHGNCGDLNNSGTLEYKEKLTRADFLGQNYISHTARDNFWIGNIKSIPSGNIPAYDVLFPGGSGRDNITEFCVEPLNFDRNFDNKSPGGCGIGNNRFAINYSINKYFMPGRYRITVGGDDGFVFGTKVDDVVLGETIHINEWRNAGYRTRTVDLDLYGFVALRLYYYENDGNARVSFNIQKITDHGPLIYGDELICGTGGTTQLSGKNASDTWTSEDNRITMTSSGQVTGNTLSTTNYNIAANRYLPRVRINRGSTTISARRLVVTSPLSSYGYTIQPTSCYSKGSIRASAYSYDFGSPFIWCKDNFSSTTPQIGVNSRLGSAAINNGSLRLTDAINSQTGTLVINNPGNFNSQILTTTFNMYMGGGSSADGIVVSYGNVGIYFDSYNNHNSKTTTSETGSTCEPRKLNGQGVSVKIVDANNHQNVYSCLSSYTYDLRDNWNNVMIYINGSALSVIINGNYVIDNINVSQLSSNKTGWDWRFKGLTGQFNDIHRIDDLSIVSYNDSNSFVEFSIDSTNGINGNWASNSNGDTIFDNLENGTYQLRVRSKFAANRTPCLTPQVIGTYTIDYLGDRIALSTGNWGESLRWRGNTIPDINSCVIIPSGITITVPSSYTGSAHRITVQSGGKLVVQSGAKLRVLNEIINENTDPSSVVFESNTDFIQINNPSATIFNRGKVTVKRAANPMDKYGYTYWGSPVTGQNTITGTPLYPGANAAFRWNTNPGGSDPDGLIGWVQHNGEMIPGQGYILRAPQNLSPWNQQIGGVWQKASVTANFIGVPNNGDCTVDIVPSATGLIPHYNAKMTYMSNPYPATIHIDKFLNQYGQGIALSGNARIIPTVYFWTHATTPMPNASGGYTYPTADFASYTLLGGTAAVNDVQNVRPRGYVAPGQGFFVQGLPAGGTVMLRNTYKHNSSGTGATPFNDSQFFRVGKIENEEENDTLSIEKHRIWLNLKSEDNTKFKEILVGYSNLGTDEVDGLDGLLHSSNLPFQLYTKIGSELFSIQSLALPFDESDIVPLGLKIDQAGIYSIALSDFDGLFENQEIYLRDKLNGVEFNIREGEYTFYSTVGTFEDRFEVFFAARLSIDDSIKSTDWLVYKQRDNIIVSAKNFEMKTIEVYDVVGKKIYDKVVNSDYHIISSIRGNQMLIVKVITQDGITLSRKVLN